MSNLTSLHRLFGDRLLASRLYRAARESYNQALEDDPQDADAMVGLARAIRRGGDSADRNTSVTWAERALAADPHHVDAWFERAHGLVVLGLREDAAAAYAKVLELDPSHVEASYYRDLCRGVTPARIPASLIAELFDHYADTFGEHLLHELHYQVPGHLRAAVDAVRGRESMQPTAWTIADLGCGTGLSGRAFRDMASRLVGIDLSAKMVDQSRETGVYDELRVGDLVSLLGREAEYGLLAAADVFVYMGDLGPVFSACARALRPRGLLAFTTEAFTEEDIASSAAYVHSEAGRFRHSQTYVVHAAEEAGFEPKLQRAIVGRSEGNRPVRCYVYVLEKE